MTNQENKDISPDGKWKVVFDPSSGIRWVQLTQPRDQFTIKEIVEATKKIAPYIRAGNLVLLESTSPVGTTDMISKILESEGVDIQNIYIAHSPPTKVAAQPFGHQH